MSYYVRNALANRLSFDLFFSEILERKTRMLRQRSRAICIRSQLNKIVAPTRFVSLAHWTGIYVV